VGFELTLVSQLALDEVGSPSHAVRVGQGGGHSVRIALATGNDVPNCDLGLDARFQTVEPQVLAGRDKSGLGRFAAIVPSSSFGIPTEALRRVVILLDRSGSMEGAPMAQARKAIEACLGVLSESDSFGLVTFARTAMALQPAMVSGTREWRDKAHVFLMQVESGGGTELAMGFLEAAKLLEGVGGDILIFTDGQVSGTEKILADARSAGVRLHCLGIGSASQDRFLALLARETGGVSRFVTPRERVDLSAVDLFASVGRPVVSGLKAGANIQPEPSSLVFSGTPVILFGEVGETAEQPIELRWDGGELHLPVAFGESDVAETVWLLQGSRLITHWESRYPSAEAWMPLEKRKQSRVAARLLALSRTYGLASREMSLVAVMTRPGDRPGELPETQVVPIGMPQDTNFEAYFSGQPDMKVRAANAPEIAFSLITETVKIVTDSYIAPLSSEAGSVGPPLYSRVLRPASSRRARPRETDEDILLDLASRMAPDGGMPGKGRESRAISTVIALLAFLSLGHTPWDGAFRSHAARLVSFLELMGGLSSHHQRSSPRSSNWLAKARGRLARG